MKSSDLIGPRSCYITDEKDAGENGFSEIKWRNIGGTHESEFSSTEYIV